MLHQPGPQHFGPTLRWCHVTQAQYIIWHLALHALSFTGYAPCGGVLRMVQWSHPLTAMQVRSDNHTRHTLHTTHLNTVRQVTHHCDTLRPDIDRRTHFAVTITQSFMFRNKKVTPPPVKRSTRRSMLSLSSMLLLLVCLSLPAPARATDRTLTTHRCKSAVPKREGPGV